jgi:hypothetical protein
MPFFPPCENTQTGNSVNLYELDENNSYGLLEVNQIIAGSNITISPTQGTGNVTINSTGISVPVGVYKSASIIPASGMGTVASPVVINSTTGNPNQNFQMIGNKVIVNITDGGYPFGRQVFFLRDASLSDAVAYVVTLSKSPLAQVNYDNNRNPVILTGPSGFWNGYIVWR